MHDGKQRRCVPWWYKQEKPELMFVICKCFFLIISPASLMQNKEKLTFMMHEYDLKLHWFVCIEVVECSCQLLSNFCGVLEPGASELLSSEMTHPAAKLKCLGWNGFSTSVIRKTPDSYFFYRTSGHCGHKPGCVLTERQDHVQLCLEWQDQVSHTRSDHDSNTNRTCAQRWYNTTFHRFSVNNRNVSTYTWFAGTCTLTRL